MKLSEQFQQRLGKVLGLRRVTQVFGSQNGQPVISDDVANAVISLQDIEKLKKLEEELEITQTALELATKDWKRPGKYPYTASKYWLDQAIERMFPDGLEVKKLTDKAKRLANELSPRCGCRIVIETLFGNPIFQHQNQNYQITVCDRNGSMLYSQPWIKGKAEAIKYLIENLESMIAERKTLKMPYKLSKENPNLVWRFKAKQNVWVKDYKGKIVKAKVVERCYHPNRCGYINGEGYRLDGYLWWDCYPSCRVAKTREEAKAIRLKNF